MKNKTVSILNYGRGNIRSIYNALDRIGCTAEVIETLSEIKASRSIIFPGVGAYGAAMEQLQLKGMDEEIIKFAESGRLLMGICLGMQLLFETGEEFGHHEGLAIMKGSVRPIPEEAGIKIPHVNWRPLTDVSAQSRLLSSSMEAPEYYFIHSFHCDPSNPEDVTSTVSINDWNFCASVERDNIFGCQFHPEKSSENGLKVLAKFAGLVEKNYV